MMTMDLITLISMVFDSFLVFLFVCLFGWLVFFVCGFFFALARYDLLWRFTSLGFCIHLETNISGDVMPL